MFSFTRYSDRQRDRWDSFAKEARNSTFLFERGYMDYHSDRFSDCSLMALKDGKLTALLPANLTGDGVLHSHQGLTYGGWILPKAHFDAVDMIQLFEDLRQWCLEEGITALDYKPLPWIYATQPSQEDIYALFRMGATVKSALISSTIDMRHNRGFNTLQRRHLRKASKTGAELRETRDAAEFMTLVAECLKERYGAEPVHSAAEAELLMARFPENIRCFGAYGMRGIEAGVMTYVCGTTVHCQYIATTPEARRDNLLTLLFHHLITEVFAEAAYFDFGTSNEDGGLYLNPGLLRQKASLGGSGTAYMRYNLDFTRKRNDGDD